MGCKASRTGIWRRNQHRILRLISVSIGEEAKPWFHKHCGEQLRARQTQIQFLTSGLAFLSGFDRSNCPAQRRLAAQ